MNLHRKLYTEISTLMSWHLLPTNICSDRCALEYMVVTWHRTRISEFHMKKIEFDIPFRIQ
jgi:hypothetical protein